MDKAELALIFSEAAAFTGNDHTLIGIFSAPDVFHAHPTRPPLSTARAPAPPDRDGLATGQ